MLSKIDEIDEIDDFCEIMKLFGFSVKGCKGVDEMRIRLCEYLEDLERLLKWKVGEVSIILLFVSVCYFLYFEISILFNCK